MNDLDRSLLAAGRLLDSLADERAAALATTRRRRPDPGRRLGLAAAVVAFVALSVGAALVVASSSDDPGPTVASTSSTTTRPDPDAPDLTYAELPTLGLTGLVVASKDGLVDLATGEVTPLVSPGDWAGDFGSPTAAPDGEGGLYYLSVVRPPDDGISEAGELMGHMDMRHLTADGADEVVQEGVTSFALRPDGALALSVGLEVEHYNTVDYPTEIVVVAADGARTTWSTAPGDLRVVAWAGDRLLAERGIEDTEAVDTLVYDGPGRSRDLASYGRPLVVGSAGRWAVVEGGVPGADRAETVEIVPPRVLDLATGAVLGTVDTGDPVRRISGLTWAGPDRLVAATSTLDGVQQVLLTLSVTEAEGAVSIAVSDVVPLQPGVTSVPDVVWAEGDALVALAPTNDRRHQTRLFVCPLAAGETPCVPITPPFGQEPSQVARVATAG
jgi:hypothetical protein